VHGAGFAHLHRRRHDSTVTKTDLFDFLLAHPEIRAVSSHHLRFPKPESDEFFFVDAIFLRHPLDRLRSMYDFYRRMAEDNGDPLTEHAKHLDLGTIHGIAPHRLSTSGQ
jgi:hypothetical protein